jgi:hypothetical protein
MKKTVIIFVLLLVYASCGNKEDKIYTAIRNFIVYEQINSASDFKELIIVSIDETPEKHLTLMREDALEELNMAKFKQQTARNKEEKDWYRETVSEYTRELAHLDSLLKIAGEKEYNVYFVLAHYTTYVSRFDKDMSFGNSRFIVTKKDFQVIRRHKFEY